MIIDIVWFKILLFCFLFVPSDLCALFFLPSFGFIKLNPISIFGGFISYYFYCLIIALVFVTYMFKLPQSNLKWYYTTYIRNKNLTIVYFHFSPLTFVLLLSNILILHVTHILHCDFCFNNNLLKRLKVIKITYLPMWLSFPKLFLPLSIFLVFLLMVNSFRIFKSKNIFIALLFWNDTFAGCIFLTWQFLVF